MNRHTQVAIIGAGFAGLSVHIMLRKLLGKDVDIKLFDMRESFTYTPGLHLTIGKYKRLKNLQFSFSKYYGEDFVCAEVVKVNKDHTLLTAQGDKRTFDYAVIATGSTTNYFGNFSFEKNSFAIRNPEDICPLNIELEKSQTISVIGGGYTGVEVASVAAVRYPHKKIRLIHSGNRILHDMSERTSSLATKRLLNHNVQLILNDRVVKICETDITLESGTKLDSDTTILVSGIKPNDKLHEQELTFSDAYKSLQSENILVCGDASSYGLYTTAHNAMIEGRRMGKMIADKINGIHRHYQPLKNRSYLALALGPYDGLFTTPTRCIQVPRLTGFAKWFIEQRVLIEFKYKIMLPV